MRYRKAKEEMTNEGLKVLGSSLGEGVAPIAIAVIAGHYGMSFGIGATAGMYLLIGLLMLWGAMRLVRDRETGPNAP